MTIIYHEHDSFETIIEDATAKNGIFLVEGKIRVKVDQVEIDGVTRYWIGFSVLLHEDGDPVAEVDELLPAYTRRETAIRKAIALYDDHDGKYSWPHEERESHPAYRKQE